MVVTTGMLVVLWTRESFSPLLFVAHLFMAVSVSVIAHDHNRHKFNNRAGDYTITYRFTEKTNLCTLLTYPNVSAFHQQKPIRGYLETQYRINNGLHTVHYDNPGLHWSKTPAAHAKIADQIDPRLNERSFWWMLVHVYILGMFNGDARSRSMRLERMAAEQQI